MLRANSRDSDQITRNGASDLGLQCLPMSHKKDARLILVNNSQASFKTNHSFPRCHLLFCKLIAC